VKHFLNKALAPALGCALVLGAAAPALAETASFPTVISAQAAATPASTAVPTPAGPPVTAREAVTTEVVVGAGKSQVIQLPAAYTDVMVADPKIADILPLTNRSVYVVGKTAGSTALTIYGPGKSLIAAVNVVVSADIDSLKVRLSEVLPRERDISVRAANQSIVLSGTVSSPSALQQVMSLAQSYAPDKVINMMGVEGTQQVMLSVRFVEMQRSVAKDLRLNVASQDSAERNGNGFAFLSGAVATGTDSILEKFGLTSLVFHGGTDTNVLIDALETKGLVKTLAEPTLVAMSGDTASFLAGGEFPIPVAQSGGGIGSAPTITIEYKQFGVALSFTPTLLSDGLINLVVNPEVSSIDPANSIELGLIRVPGIKVRRAHTTVELRDGESFTIAGLLRDDYQSEIKQYPFLGDMPVLGALFRSNGYLREETELVIVVTPHLAAPRRAKVATPADRFLPPSDFEQFAFGAQRSGEPLDRILHSSDPTKGGVDGPHGHILN
jgi:pilus assembly protein CpaC